METLLVIGAGCAIVGYLYFHGRKLLSDLVDEIVKALLAVVQLVVVGVVVLFALGAVAALIANETRNAFIYIGIVVAVGWGAEVLFRGRWQIGVPSGYGRSNSSNGRPSANDSASAPESLFDQQRFADEEAVRRQASEERERQRQAEAYARQAQEAAERQRYLESLRNF